MVPTYKTKPVKKKKTKVVLLAGLLIAAWAFDAHAGSPAERIQADCPKCVLYHASDGAWVLLPNPTLTPGASDPSLTERQACTPEADRGKDERVVSATVKAARYAAYGVKNTSHWIVSKRTGKKVKQSDHEVDHDCMLKLCGSNDPKNLWVQSYLQHPGAHEKDALEMRLARLVCHDHALTLRQAQDTFLKGNWYEAYLKYVKAKP